MGEIFASCTTDVIPRGPFAEAPPCTLYQPLSWQVWNSLAVAGMYPACNYNTDNTRLFHIFLYSVS